MSEPKVKHPNFREHLEHFARTHRLELRLDEDVLDLECLDSMERVHPTLFDDSKQALEQTCIYEFCFARAEVFPQSSDSEAAAHAEALRFAGFGENNKKRKNSHGITEAEKAFACFIANNMERSGALDRLERATEKMVALKRTYDAALAAIEQFEDENGTDFDVQM
jgi:hypothetical protein